MAKKMGPPPYQTPIIGQNGALTSPWVAFFRDLFSNINTNSGALTNPMTAVGDMIFGAGSGNPARLPGNTANVKKFLSQTGSGSASAQPIWQSLQASDIPDNAANTSGSAASLSQALTQFAVILGAGTGIQAMGSLGTAGQSLVSQGPGLAPSWATVGGLAVYGTRSSPVLITAAGGITPNSDQRQLIRIKGSGGTITITASPAIAPGSIDGQELILEGSSTSSAVYINNGTGLEQGGTMELGVGDKIAYLWNAGANIWTEMWRFYSGISGEILTDDSGNPLTDNSGNPLTG